MDDEARDAETGRGARGRRLGVRRRHRVREILAINQLGSRTPAGPLFIYQSTNDTFIPMEDVNALVACYCD